MRFSQCVVQDVCIFTPYGRLDANTAPALRQQLMAADCVERGGVVDFSAVDFMDSSGLGALIAAVRRLRKGGRDLKIACPNDNVQRVFDLTSANRLFEIFAQRQSALDSFIRERGE
ncbi:MAG: STAS domain-containing protein [Thermodesulfobacteriota bacterium]